ncbi:hypothetical protein MAR_000276, partial [Mya arenaria]
VSLFREFLGENCEFEGFSSEELNKCLRAFFASIRKTYGSELKKSSLTSIKYGICKYLKDECKIDVCNDNSFSSCLTTFQSKVTDLPSLAVMKPFAKGKCMSFLVMSIVRWLRLKSISANCIHKLIGYGSDRLIASNLMDQFGTVCSLRKGKTSWNDGRYFKLGTFTNHCIRATSISELDRNGIEARHLVRVSGHKSEMSIRSYSRRLCDEKQQQISDTLAKDLAEKAKCDKYISTGSNKSTSSY